MTQEKQISTMLEMVYKALEELKAIDIVEIDVHDKPAMTEIMIVATGTSTRHVKAIGNNLVEKAKEHGFRPLGIEGEESSEWVLVDLGDIIVHIMQAKIRDYYQIEKLWEVGPSVHSAVEN